MQFVASRTKGALLFVMFLAATALASDWERGVALYNKGDYRRGIVEFQDIVLERPDVAGAWYTIGISHYLEAHYDKAIDPLKRYLDITAAAKRDIDPSARTALGR